MTDQGTEFFNKSFQTLLKNEGIELFNTFNKTTASIVERVICTSKTKMWCYFTAKTTMRYLDMLPDLVYSYNHSEQGYTTRSKELQKVIKHNDMYKVEKFLKSGKGRKCRIACKMVWSPRQIQFMECFCFICCIIVIVSGKIQR